MAPAGSDTALAAGAPWNAGDPAGGAGQCGRRGGGTGESLRQGHKHLHVAEREEARLAVQHALVPVLIDLVGQRDDVTLTEAQLPVVLGLEVVQRLAARLVQGRWGREQAVGLGLLRLTPPSLGSQTCCDLERVGGHGPPLCPAWATPCHFWGPASTATQEGGWEKLGKWSPKLLLGGAGDTQCCCGDKE